MSPLGPTSTHCWHLQSLFYLQIGLWTALSPCPIPPLLILSVSNSWLRIPLHEGFYVYFKLVRCYLKISLTNVGKREGDKVILVQRHEARDIAKHPVGIVPTIKS